jgi:fimbrial chaperone protein
MLFTGMNARLGGLAMLVLLMCTQPITAHAVADIVGGVSLGQTRVVFLSTDKAQSLMVKNTDSRAYLIQSHVESPVDETVPSTFVVTPPLFLLKPDSRQLLRILPPAASLPTDRESLFYLSIIAIPSQEDKGKTSAQVSMGLRFMLKLFYRPAALEIMPASAVCALRFHRERQGIRVDNPTPYFQTLGQLTFNRAPVNLHIQPSMLNPMSSHLYPASDVVKHIKWQVITDYGSLSESCQQTLEATKKTP